MLELFQTGFNIENVVGNTFNFILILIAFDIFTGILVAGKERKINSSINLTGLIRKVGLITGVAFITVIDVYFQKDGIIIKGTMVFLIGYEGMSIIENFDRLGINLKMLTKYFERGEK